MLIIKSLVLWNYFSQIVLLFVFLILRAFTVTLIYRIKNPNITKNWENRITAISLNERNTEADEQ
jgi:uncharacterized membrane protein YjfL (UPF0719 family)